MSDGSKFENVVLPRSPLFNADGGQPPSEVEVHTFRVIETKALGDTEWRETHEDRPEIEAVVHQSGSVKIWQAEGLEPCDFIKIVAEFHAGVCEARGLMGQDWTAPIIPTSIEFDAVLEDYLTREGDILRVRFGIYPVNKVTTDGQARLEYGEHPVLSGQIDWQNGILLGETESLTVENLVPVMATLHAAIWEARDRIGELWIHGEAGRAYDPNDVPTG